MDGSSPTRISKETELLRDDVELHKEKVTDVVSHVREPTNNILEKDRTG